MTDRVSGIAGASEAAGQARAGTLTRLYDWINRDANAHVKVKDLREHLTKRHFHQTAPSAAAYGWSK
jgi:hypothetical protein